MRRKMNKLRKKEARDCYLFLLIWIIGFALFWIGPTIVSFILSFSKWDILSPLKWVGLENYKFMLFKDPRFWKAVWNTAYYTAFFVPLNIVGGVFIALLMNQKIIGIKGFRTVYFMPFLIVTSVGAAFLWMWVFSPRFGILNFFLSILGIHGPAWLVNEKWIKPAFVIMGLWGVGGSMIIYLGALQSIPTQLYESAEVEGANLIQKFFHITLPMLTPVIFFNLIIGIIGSFQIFTQSYIMTEEGGGGPNNSALFYVLYLYHNAFRYWKMGYAAALAWVLFIIILFFTLVQFKIASKWVYYEAEAKK